MKKCLEYKVRKIMLSTMLASYLVAQGKNVESLDSFHAIDMNEDLEEEKTITERKKYIEVCNEIDFNDRQEFRKGVEQKFIRIPSVTANTNVNIRKSPTEEGELAGKLVEGHTLELLKELDNGWDEVLYYGKVCYVNREYVSKTTTYQVNGDIKKMCYATNSVLLTIPKGLSSTGKEEKVTLPALEFFEIYEEKDDTYLVQTNDYVGYISKTFLEELTGTIVVVDISDQELKLYYNKEVVLETPVVTGKPSTPSDEGLFKIYAFKYNDYLRGEGYASYVDIMMKYNNGEGLHDAQYHSCNNGKQNNHGWRSPEEYGGNTYLTNGSHGCINMLYDDAFTVFGYVEEGTLVLVKK